MLNAYSMSQKVLLPRILSFFLCEFICFQVLLTDCYNCIFSKFFYYQKKKGGAFLYTLMN